MPTPTEQLLSRTLYTTDGITTDWDFSFSGGYLLKSHVKALTETPEGARNEITVTESMLTGPFTLRITPALVAGNTLIIYRDTPKDLPLVDFTDESGFSEVSLDTNAKQAVFIAAEAVDIINTGSSFEAEEAANQAANSAIAAAASALAAAASASQSAASASAAEGSATDAALSATAAYNSALIASASAQTVFDANTTAYSKTLLDDTSAEAARSTLGATESGANSTITSLSSVTSINGGQIAGMRNRIINGNFDVWQRGDNFPALAGAYTADRWFMNHSAGSLSATYTKQAFTVGQSDVPNNPTYFFRNTVTAATAFVAQALAQRIENVATFAGRVVTLSFYAKSDAARTLGIRGNQYFGSGGSASVPFTGSVTSVALSTTWQRFQVQITLPSILGKTVGVGSYVDVTFDFPNTVQVTDIAQVQLELGDKASVFEQRPIGLELMLCQRYYEVGDSTKIRVVDNSNTVTATVFYKVTKRTAPTLANTGAWPTLDVGTSSFTKYLTGAGTLDTGYFVWTASAEL